jgi:haloalkane dehalogenase
MFPNTESVFVGKGRHYIQEDQPVAIGVALSNWLERTS